MIINPFVFGGGATDPDFASVVNLSHFNGANGSSVYYDSSSYAHDLIGSSGQISTTESKFGGASLRTANGTTDGVADTDPIYIVGTQDFTIEWQMRPDSILAAQNIIFFDTGNSTGFYYNAVTGTVVAYLQGVGRITSSAALVANTWTYLAYDRTGSTGTLYMDGVSQGTWSDTLNYSTGNCIVGRQSGATLSFIGYIDEFRLTIGVGRYPSSCPVQTAPWPDA